MKMLLSDLLGASDILFNIFLYLVSSTLSEIVYLSSSIKAKILKNTIVSVLSVPKI